MLARFFVDRPIFAWVISIVITLVGAVALFSLPIAEYPAITPPTVQVTAVYPGANAEVVAESIAAPIEQQVNGVENMLYMSSQCTNDGAYNLTVTFGLGIDLNTAQVLVQNRVALATPQLPPEVQVQGVSVKKRSPSVLLVVNLISPDNRFDDLFLSNYATIQIKDELARLNGVGDVMLFGQRDYSMRVWLDPERLASRNLTAADVLNAVKGQNVQVAAGEIGKQPIPTGQQFQYTMSTLGRLQTVEEFTNIVVKASSTVSDTGSGSRTSTPLVRLRDVARVELGSQQYEQFASLDGRPSVGIAIFQLPGSNALDTAEGVKKKMETLKLRFPTGVDYRIVYDTTPFIEQSVAEVFATLRDAVILVAIVVLLFLQDWRAMILPMIDVPVSLIGTLAVMALVTMVGTAINVPALVFSLNNLTLFGMVLAIGIVVDDAIVVLENIERLIGDGLNARDATIQAMEEITGPIIAITLVLCSVFIPAAFLTGVTGQFFRQFALTIAAAMVISAINAMTLTPARAVTIFSTDGQHGHVREALPWWFFGMIGSYLSYKGLAGPWMATVTAWFAHDPTEAPRWVGWAALLLLCLPGAILGGLFGWVAIRRVNLAMAWFFRGFNRMFDALASLYGAAVGRLLRVSVLVLLIYGGLLGLTYYTISKAPTGFIPQQDRGYLLVNVQLPDSASLERTQEVMTKIDRLMLGDDTGKYHGPPLELGEKRFPGVAGVSHSVRVAGQSFLMGCNGSNFGSVFVILDPFDKRASDTLYDGALAGQMQQLLNEEIDGAVAMVFRAPPIMGLGNAGGFRIQVEQRGYVDNLELQRATDELVAAGRTNPKFAGLFSIYRAETPQLFLDVDRAKCESMDVELTSVFSTLQVYMGGAFVNLFNNFGRTWQVNLMAEPKFRTSAEALSQLKVRSRHGQMVPLGSLVEVRNHGGPIMVTRYNMFSSAAINGVPAPGVSSGEITKTIDDLANQLGIPFEWTEITFLQLQAGNLALLVFVLGSVLVYLVLAAKYESWNLPLSVILVVPLCLLCAVTGMLIAGLAVDIFVQIGFLVLVGLAAKNAILIVEFAEQLRRMGKPLKEATVEACRLRLRPIVMTSFAFILGVLPLVFSHGAGAEMRRSLGIAVFSGMLGVTIFGIFLTPVFYYSLQQWKTRRELRAATRKAAAQAIAPTQEPQHAVLALEANLPAPE